MAKLLTIRKEAWVKRRKPNMVRGTPLNLPTSLELRYANRLEALVIRMCADVERQLKRLFDADHAQEYFDTAQDASISSQARILTNAIMRKFNKQFSDLATPIAEAHVNAVDKASSGAVYSSLKEMSGGLSLPTTSISSAMGEVLNATIIENVSLIKSISMEYLAGVQGAVMRSITTGRGMQDLLPYLVKHREISYKRARMIAYDQTRKAYNNLNRGRMEDVGLKKFEWLHTSGSKHPRKLHIDYDGQIFSFDNLPVIDENTGEHGIPGQAINCKCRMRPVLDFGD